MTQLHHSINHAIALFKTLHGNNIEYVIDVGANTGTPFLKDSFPNAHHYLIEPLTNTHPQLIENYQDVAYTLLSTPLLDTITPIHFYTYSVTTNEGLCNSSVLVGENEYIGNNYTLSHTITTSTLDNTFSSNTNINRLNTIIKIDVDGNELKILKGGETLLSNIGLVIIECNAQSINSIMSLLYSMGFELFDIVSPGYYRDIWIQSDLIFINQKVKNDNVKFRPFDEGAWTGSEWYPLP